MQFSVVCQNLHRVYTFSSVWEPSLTHPSQILFLNKIDLFADKLPRSPLGDYFPDYTGGADYNSACEYLLQRFVSLNQSAATKQIYAHYTCATDTNQIKCMSSYIPFHNIHAKKCSLVVLNAISDILLQIHLRECGLL
jgi:guanine nucleotide-binding protein subunit alpha